MVTAISTWETQLLDSVGDISWRASLVRIRSAVESLWSEVRLVQDFTRHDISHAMRLCRYLGLLLGCNDGKPLSTEESYALLAAVYLHDVGMQCHQPSVHVACGLNVKPKPTSQLTPDEQKAIRSRHHLLTGEWIKYAYTYVGPETTDFILAIKSMPDRLVGPIIDICRFHSKLDLANCEEIFHCNGPQRRRLIALLLRLADEMDIGADRVDINTVSNFTLSPENELYWWLHYSTEITIEDRILTFHVSASEDDIEAYGPKIWALVVDQFRTKNGRLLDLLARNRILVHLDLDQEPSISSSFAIRRLPVHIKGFIDKRLEDDRTRPGGRQRLTTLLIGRDEEMATLVQATRQGELSVVDGIAGSGKTYLCRHLVKRTGQRTIWIDCKPELRVDTLLQKVNAELIAQGDFRFEAVSQNPRLCLEERAAYLVRLLGPGYLMILDNYQDVVDPNIDTLVSIWMVDAGGTGVVIVSRTLPEFVRRYSRGTVRRLHLQGLDESDAMEYLSRKLGIDAPPTTLEKIAQKTLGIPLAMNLFWVLAQYDSIDNVLSSTPRYAEHLLNEEFVKRALGVLSERDESQYELLLRFSVYREPVQRDAFLCIWPRDSDELVNDLIDRLLINHEGGWYGNAHPLIAEYCYSQLAPSDRQTAHLGASAYYADARRQSTLMQLERHHHLFEAGETISAASVLASLLRQRMAHVGNPALFSDLLNRYDRVELPTDTRIWFLRARGDVADISGDLDQAENLYEQMLSLAISTSDREAQATANFCLGIAVWRQGGSHNIERALEYQETAKAIAEQEGFDRLLSSVLNELGLLYQASVVDDKELVSRVGLFEVQQRLLPAMASHPEVFRRSIECLERSLRIAQKLDDPALLLHSYCVRGLAYQLEGRFKEAEHLARSALAVSQKTRSPISQGWGYNDLGLVMHFARRWDEAIEAYSRSIQIKKEIGDRVTRGLTQVSLAQAYLARGDTQEAGESFAQARDLFREIGDRPMEEFCTRCLQEMGRADKYPRTLSDSHA